MLKSYFELQTSFKVSYAPACVKKWRSTRTGLQVTLIDQASPIVNGYFAVATEILNDSGCPHTLEHLVFMGSKKYPYKGLLDILGNLAFSSTNAWTATDQTVYTLTTAGWEGFKMLLPIYLDHVFNPTLTDAACYTEVHHIDGEGDDKGVVYSEMQGIENQSWFIQNLETQRTMFHNSGYKSETGGLTTNLRSLNAQTIRDYHKDNYRPDNLCVIITGSVDEEELLAIMTQLDSELDSLPSEPNLRPFVDTPKDSALTETVIKTVEFPDEDESSGDVNFAWIGPEGTDLILDQAMDTIGKYLTSSSVSLLNQEFIEIENPIASSSGFYTESYVNSCIHMSLSNVPTGKLDSVPQLVLDLLKTHCTKEQLDLKRLREITEQSMWKYIYQTEKSSENLATLAIFEFEYGNINGQDLKEWGMGLKEYEEVLKWDIDQWAEVFQKYIVNNHSCIVISKPSKALYKSSKIANKEFLQNRKAELGEEGLAKLKEDLKKAQDLNETPIPDEILNSFGQPDPSKIDFIKTESLAIGTNKDILNNLESNAYLQVSKDTPADFPLYMHIENTETNFVSIQLLFSSFEVDEELLPLLVVFQCLFTLPIQNEDGSLIPYDEVVKELKKDTISYSFDSAIGSACDELLNLKIVVKAKEYSNALKWFTRLMFQTKFTKERVLVSLKKAIKTMPELKRSGTSMLRSLVNRKMFTERSYLKSCDSYYNEQYYRTLMKQVEASDEKEFAEIESKFEKIRSQLFSLNNTRVFMVGDVFKIESPVSQWDVIVNKLGKPSDSKLIDFPDQTKVLSEIGSDKSNECYIITTPGSDSSYMNLITKIPVRDFTSKDSYMIGLGIAYLQCVEGPFWRGIRGAGLAYGANSYRNGETGELVFSIYRGADIEKCFEIGRKLVSDFVTGETVIDEKMMHGALSSIVSTLAEGQSNASASATSKYVNDVVYKRGPNYNEKFMSELRKITTEDLKQIYEKYFINMFDPKTSVCFIGCNPSKSEAIVEYFKNVGYNMNVENIETSADVEEELSGSDEEDGSVSGGEDDDSESGSESGSGSESETDSESGSGSGSDSGSESESESK